MSSVATPRGGKFVDDGVDTSPFDHWEGDPTLAGPPKLPRKSEKLRLKTLYNLVKISDTEDPVIISMCKLVRAMLRVPVAGISILDKNRCWTRTPESVLVIPRNISLCFFQLTNTPPGVLCIEDTTTDPRSENLPHVKGAPGTRFYASAPLIASNGCVLGTMCVVDFTPRHLVEEQLAMLVNAAECNRAAAGEGQPPCDAAEGEAEAGEDA
eukprot:jgi/Botrbrau1/107/Bobra.0022s0096.1